GFPTHFISTIDLYRDCYENSSKIEQSNRTLVDLIPDDQIQAAWRNLLLSLALQVVVKNQNADYVFGNEILGGDRHKIAEKWTYEFSSQTVYERLCEHLQELEAKMGSDIIYARLQQLQSQIDYPKTTERALLGELLGAYNPLN
ncbi:MAG TPA: hypothetical protein V6C65_17235, partial [Allocoleopsis sp.]